MVVLEIIMTLTDPPVKLLRRIIPQLTIGAVRFDLSIMVLLLVAFIGMQLAFGAAADLSGRSVPAAIGRPDARPARVVSSIEVRLLIMRLPCNRRVWCDRMDASYSPARLYTLRSVDGPDFKGADNAAHTC